MRLLHFSAALILLVDQEILVLAGGRPGAVDASELVAPERELDVRLVQACLGIAASPWASWIGSLPIVTSSVREPDPSFT
jgi:hypothetical protein